MSNGKYFQQYRNIFYHTSFITFFAKLIFTNNNTDVFTGGYLPILTHGITGGYLPIIRSKAELDELVAFVKYYKIYPGITSFIEILFIGLATNSKVKNLKNL